MDERTKVSSNDEPSGRKRTRATWEQPTVTELPKLTELTLLTGSSVPGAGGTLGGGSTVF
jgi:hypothetical protein